MSDRGYRSIGETLEFIKEEFPEITISKIRFLETQGLIAPERTTNGYRKFYDHDIERLSFVLRQQREQFLPLKVIKDRITEKEPGVFILDPSKGRFAKSQKTKNSKFEKNIFGDPLDVPTPSVHSRNTQPQVEPKTPWGSEQSIGQQSAGTGRNEHAAPAAVNKSDGNPSRAGYTTDPAIRGARNPTTESPYVSAENTKSPNPNNSSQVTRPPSAKRPRLFALPSNSALAENLDDPRATDDESSEGAGGFERGPDGGESDFPKNSFTARNIAEQADLSLVQVEDLTTFGLLNPTSIRGQRIYCTADLELATLAKEFAKFGLEARHLKMYKISAEREASFLEQVILPILANKSQKSRNRAEVALTQLGEIGAQFRTLLLERTIDKILNP